VDFWTDKHDATTVAILDDHFLFDVPRAIEILDYIGSKRAKSRMPTGLAISCIDKNLVDCFVRNGVDRLNLALESGSERVLREIMRKPLKLEVASKVFDMLKDTGIFVAVFLVIGFEGETLNDYAESLEYLRNANYHWAYVFGLMPVSGSAVFEQFGKKYVVASDGSYDFDNSYSRSNAFSSPAISERFCGDPAYTINLDLNFKHNPYMRQGKYELALAKFSSIAHTYPEHALAWYYLSKCQEKLGRPHGEAFGKYRAIIENSLYWRGYAEYFGLETESNEANEKN
jgi:radical SAM superfamily enzyme YgiQ (UPF0313 family)